MLKLRILTAAVLIPVFVLSTLYLNTFWFAILLASVLALAAWEWAGIAGFKNPEARCGYTISLMIILSSFFLFPLNTVPLWLISAALLWWFIALLLVLRYQHRGKIDINRHFSALIGVLVLLPCWLSLVVMHADEPDGVVLVLFLLILIWSADIAAYFAGRRWGKRKLCSQVSPGKSWEGVYGAIAASVVLAMAFAVSQGWSAAEILIFVSICIITVLASILGDLLESLMKRINKVKDSGTIVPGHGGVLDRIDSLTAALPVYFCCLWFWGKIA